MRIVQVCPFFKPHIGGVESHVEIVATELARRGHHVTVLTSRHARTLPRGERDPKGFYIVRTPSLGTLMATPITLMAGRTLGHIPADVVHLHYPPPLTSYFAARVLKHTDTPVCLTYHCDLLLDGPIGRLLTGLYQKVFLPPTLEAAQRVILHTGEYGKTSRNLRNARLVVIPSPVDMDRFTVRKDDPALRHALGLEGRRVILFVGRLVPHKGVDDLLHALSRMPPDVALVIVGMGPELPHLQALTQESSLAERVRFAGAVSDDDLLRYYAIASIVVSPSQNRLEGFGLAAVQAMASGRPVVVADMPGMREVVEEGRDGLLAQPLIPEDLAEKCMTLLSDPVRLEAMGRTARENAERKYRVSAVVDQLEALYQEMVASRPASPG